MTIETTPRASVGSNPMQVDPAEFERRFQDVFSRLDVIEGWMKPREVEMLCLLAGYPTAPGDVLEIGSYRGRSTTALALASRWAGDDRIVAVDPLPNVGPMSPDEHGEPSALARIGANLEKTGVREQVDLYAMRSDELLPTWVRPLRLLWIDGDHSYAGAKTDFDGFAPHLSDGAMVAFHDVLHYHEGPVRVFLEDVLHSPHFGAAGITGSIAWAQYFEDPEDAEPFREENRGLAARLHPLVAHLAFDTRPRGASRLAFRFYRSRVPHGRIDVERWASRVRNRR